MCLKLAGAALLLLAVATAVPAPAPAAVAAAPADRDFEFDDQEPRGAPPAARVRYVYDPDSPLCGGVACARGQLCALRAAPPARPALAALAAPGPAALCLPRSQVLALARGTSDDDADDVFYDSGDDEGGGGDRGDGGGGGAGGGAPPLARDTNDIDDADDKAADDDDAPLDGELDLEKPAAAAAAQCVGCASEWKTGPGGGFVCGSDNRTYSSLCRLDLHNCLRPPAPPAPRVRLQCRGFCPCRGEGAGAGEGPGVGGCDEGAGGALADRLLDWFAVLQGEQPAPPPEGFPARCRGELRWMFGHLDADADGRLARKELYALRHDERERCLRPFLESCGARGARGARAPRGARGGITRAAWCGCLRGAAAPCAALRRGASGAASSWAWRPACDAMGYFQPRQCDARGRCWCSSRHGLRRPCPPALPPHSPPSPPAPHSDDDDAGSGDAPLY